MKMNVVYLNSSVVEWVVGIERTCLRWQLRNKFNSKITRHPFSRITLDHCRDPSGITNSRSLIKHDVPFMELADDLILELRFLRFS